MIFGGLAQPPQSICPGLTCLYRHVLDTSVRWSMAVDSKSARLTLIRQCIQQKQCFW